MPSSSFSSVAATLDATSSDTVGLRISSVVAQLGAYPSLSHTTLNQRLALPPWTQPPAPALADIPDKLWGPYVDWLLAVPFFPEDAAQADAIAHHLALRIDEIAGWMERNLGSPAVRAAADAYLRAPAPVLAAFPAARRLPIQKARARVLARLQGRSSSAAIAPAPLGGRALRVGFLQRNYSARPETFATLAQITQLDRSRFEAVLFTLETDYSACETHCRDQGVAFHTLPETLAGQIAALRAERLDVLIFADDLSAHAAPLSLVALQRIAPLQAVTIATPATTALPEIDLYLAGEFDLTPDFAGQITERLALLPETAHAYDFTPDRPVEIVTPARGELGVPAEAHLIIAFAPNSPLSPATADLWARATASHPDIHLLVIPKNTDAALDLILPPLLAAFTRQFLSTERLHFLTQNISSAADMQALLGLADAALATPAHVAPLALELGLPVIALASSPTAAVLRSARLASFVAANEDAAVKQIHHLFAGESALAATREHVQSSFGALPRFADGYAHAADFGALLATAFNELTTHGPRLFRKNREPIRVARPQSLNPSALQTEGRALLAEGRPERAVPCLLSALQRAGRNASLWFDLARAYRDAGQAHTALETLEASLRLDDKNAGGWLMLCELALDVGSLDLARESLGLATALDPADERIPALRARLAA